MPKIVATSLATPAVRLLVVEVFQPEGQAAEVEFYPVAAIARNVREDGDYEDQALIVHEMCSGLTPADFACDYEDCMWELVAAPWDPDLDDDRLGPVVDRLTRGLAAQRQRQRERTQRDVARSWFPGSEFPGNRLSCPQ